jgi:hypothetical protein
MSTVALATPECPAVPAPASSRAVWLGRVLSALPVAFLAFDTGIKLLMMPIATQATRELGFTERAVFMVGLVEAVCLALYLVPRTAVLGAMLLIGYLGGAVATQVRAGGPLFSHTLFPIYVAGFLWLGLWCRDRRLRRIVRTAFDTIA